MSATDKQKKTMTILINKLNRYTSAYDEGHPLISDKEWDDMYFDLYKLELETGEILDGSPTHVINFDFVSELKKVKHNHPMLSLDKTKDFNTIKSFIKDKDWIAMCKMDGLTCSLKYVDGKLAGAETRGDGVTGENIFHNAKTLKSIPKTIPLKDEIIIDGEIICTYKNFKAFQDQYKNPRNFASGSIRLLDSKECYNRNLTFVAWDCIKGIEKDTLGAKLKELIKLGFTVVPFYENANNPNQIIDFLKDLAQIASYPIDGLVFKYNNIEEYENAGKTDHHFKGGLAYKFYDETVTSYLRDVEWTMGRTGILTPVAVFDPIEIEGTIVSRASLHNISIMKQTLGTPYLGQEVRVCKMNQIIPQIVKAQPPETNMNPEFFEIPKYCPYCGDPNKIKKEYNTEFLYCTNPNCDCQFINQLDHFCGKKGLDIKGLSKATLQKLNSWGWVITLDEIFTLHAYRLDWFKKPGFGVASVNKILSAIESAKVCSFDKYLCALGIPLIGKVASKALANEFKDYKTFRKAIDERDDRLYQIDGIGEVMLDNLFKFDYTEADTIFDKYIIEEAAVPSSNGNELEGKVFVITGKVKLYKNRDELKSFIESKGGKVTGSVTKNTNYLINNDADSTSAKNLSAKKLNIPIITEEQFQLLCSVT